MSNPDEPRAAEGRLPTVLLVDDQPDVAETGAEILEHSGYAVTLAYTTAEALEVLSRDAAIDVLFVDIGLRGGMNGLELANIVRERFPQTAVVLTTGHDAAVTEARAQGFDVLIKPYFVNSLRDAIARALTQRRPS